MPLNQIFIFLITFNLMQRIKKIFANTKDVDAIVIQNATEPHIDLTFFYITGLTSGLFESSTAILTKDTFEIIIPQLEEESAKNCKAKVNVYKTKDEREKLLKEKLKGIKKIGVNSEELTYGSYLQLKKFAKAKFSDVSESIRKARLIKDEEEIELIKKACKIVSEVANEIPSLIKEGVKENEVASEINYLMNKKGASGESFTTIPAFGKNSAEPHYTSALGKAKKGDFLLFDFGAKYQRYCSDITRTFVLGKATKQQREIYSTVLNAQQIAFDKIKQGVKGATVHKQVEKFINSAYNKKFAGKFIHSTGHSIGLSVHDGGVLHPRMDLTLKEGMVFTVEPGIYLSGFGGVRIEDDIVVKKNGIEILTNAKKELIEI